MSGRTVVWVPARDREPERPMYHYYSGTPATPPAPDCSCPSECEKLRKENDQLRTELMDTLRELRRRVK